MCRHCSSETLLSAGGTQLPSASRTVLVSGVEGGFAPRALRDLDRASLLEPGIGERVHVSLAVVPLDVLVLVDVEGGLVHPRLARVQHVLEVVLEQVPFVEVVLPAILARDHDALHALRREDIVHLAEVLQIGLDVTTLLR